MKQWTSMSKGSTGNSLFSPISILTTLNMIFLGTSGTIHKEIRETFGKGSCQIKLLLNYTKLSPSPQLRKKKKFAFTAKYKGRTLRPLKVRHIKTGTSRTFGHFPEKHFFLDKAKILQNNLG